MDYIDITIRPLKLEDINKNYISWFRDNKVTEYLEARNISIDESKKYLTDGILHRNYYIYAICDINTEEHIGNIKIGPLRRFDGISDLVTIIGNRNYWGNGVGTEAIKLVVQKAFFEEEYICEVICPSLINPINIIPILESVKKSKKLILVEEGSSIAGFGSEIISLLSEKGIRLNNVIRISNNTIIPCSFQAENDLLPNEDKIYKKIKEILK